jgi:CDP-diglyceride synthetase
MALARLIRAVLGIAVAIIVLAVILRLLGANPHNAIVSDIHDAGAWLVGPFSNVFSVSGPKLHMALNWGLAAVVYAVVGGFLASIVARAAGGGFARRGFGRTRPVA